MSSLSEYRYAFRLLILASLALLSACGGREAAIPEIPADYRSWPRSVDRVLDYPVPAHGSGARIIYMDPASYAFAKSIGGRDIELPPGATLVKEVYANTKPAAGEAPAMLTVMLKSPNDTRAQGGWLWLVKEASAQAFSVMEGDFCASCHVAANERHPYGDRNLEGMFRDYLFYLPGP